MILLTSNPSAENVANSLSWLLSVQELEDYNPGVSP